MAAGRGRLRIPSGRDDPFIRIMLAGSLPRSPKDSLLGLLPLLVSLESHRAKTPGGGGGSGTGEC